MSEISHYNHLSYYMEPPRNHYFSSNSEVPQISHFGAISDYRKMLKRVDLTIGYRKHEPGTQR